MPPALQKIADSLFFNDQPSVLFLAAFSLFSASLRGRKVFFVSRLSDNLFLSLSELF